MCRFKSPELQMKNCLSIAILVFSWSMACTSVVLDSASAAEHSHRHLQVLDSADFAAYPPHGADLSVNGRILKISELPSKGVLARLRDQFGPFGTMHLQIIGRFQIEKVGSDDLQTFRVVDAHRLTVSVKDSEMMLNPPINVTARGADFHLLSTQDKKIEILHVPKFPAVQLLPTVPEQRMLCVSSTLADASSKSAVTDGSSAVSLCSLLSKEDSSLKPGYHSFVFRVEVEGERYDCVTGSIRIDSSSNCLQ